MLGGLTPLLGRVPTLRLSLGLPSEVYVDAAAGGILEGLHRGVDRSAGLVSFNIRSGQQVIGDLAKIYQQTQAS